MTIIAFIFARGGSKGLPGKNIKLLNGLPLIAHSIHFAKKAYQIADVIVSTDSEEIACVAREYGAKTPFLRPTELSSDTAPERLAWRHAVQYYREQFGDFDYFLSLPTVSPLREQEDLIRLATALKTTTADLIVSATESEASPYTNLIEPDHAKGFRLCSGGLSTNRQEAKKVLRIIPMYYACKPESIFRLENIFDGKIDILEIPKSRAVDVDTPEDFEYLEYLSLKNLNAKIENGKNST